MRLMLVVGVAIVVLVSQCTALYDSSDDVVELTDINFKNRVLSGDEIWIVEFYAPWCGHCKNFAPEYRKAAKVLKGLVKVGAVDMTQHQSVGQPYDVKGFPTVKIFGANKQKPTDYMGPRTAKGLTDAGLDEIRKTISVRLTGKSSSGAGAGGGKKTTGGGAGGDGKDVIELTDSNFEQLVLHSKDAWLVEFFAPWCGHCKALKPEWERAASELRGKIKLGALDATVHQGMATRFGIKGFPTIKYFAPGSSADEAVDYDGGRSSSDIVQWSLNKVAENQPAPEVMEATSPSIVEEACKEKQLCIVAVLPHILDCQSKCRNDYLAVLKELGEKFKKNIWGWIWTEAGKQPDLEEAFGMGGFGYPAMAAVNYRKMKFSMLKGSFGKEGIGEFLRDLSFGRGQTAPVKGAEFPKIHKVDAWDGKDGVMPVDEDIDLSDVELEDLEDTTKKTEL